MARFQTLPDRIDCICVSIPDSQMCQNHGVSLTCNLTISPVQPPSTTKCQLDVFGTSCSWTVPAGITNIFIEVWGAGGGGGGNGNCCCCSSGPGGGAGGYVSVSIPTTPGSVYAICGATGGTMGCGQCTNGGAGNTSYVTGPGLSNLCAVGGAGGISGPCNTCFNTCKGGNFPATGLSYFGGSYQNNAIAACGEGGHIMGQPEGCRFENKGGSAPFNGGIGAFYTFISCCMYAANWGGVGGYFPGGGASGAHTSCCCAICNCGGCGAAGLVRVWF